MGTWISHVGISLKDVLGAEKFYINLFQMEVYVREVKYNGTWLSLESGTPASVAHDRGLDIGISVVKRDDFVIALHEQTSGSSPSLIEHVAVVFDKDSFTTTLHRAAEMNLQFLSRSDHRYVFIDHYGMIWEIMDSNLLLTARDMGHGWISKEGLIHTSLRGAEEHK
jgi:hypothetical protein